MQDNSEFQFLELMKKIEKSSKGSTELCQNVIGLYQSRTDMERRASRKVTKYRCVFEVSTFWSSRQKYFQLLKSFVNYDLDGEAFCSEFLSLQNEDMEKNQVLVQQVESSF